MKIKLSVIIPTYNYIANLHDCIHSVASQMTAECECVIVDDGSESSFVNELKKLEESEALRNKNVRVEYAEHRGPSEARNRGILLAKGSYITFLDGDDQMAPGFIVPALGRLSEDADLYIYSIEAIKIKVGENQVENWKVADRSFKTAADFADEYVRNRHLLLYSSCNKLYRKKLIDESGVKFDPNVTFGEDRLFNYDYLRNVGKIICSERVMFRYNIHDDNMQKQGMSLSKRHLTDYFDMALRLHEKKMECILSLTRETSVMDRHRFEQYDLVREIENTINRFEIHPEEIDECIGKINEIVFGKDREIPHTVDIVIVLGSRKCRYRIERAFELFGSQTETVFIVCGGNSYDDTNLTEADFMAAYLQQRGLEENRIIIENKSVNTEDNLGKAEKLIKDKNCKGIGALAIVTAGFHIPRTEALVEKNMLFEGITTYYIPAYGINTGRDNWFRNSQGREIVLNEIENR